MSPMGLKQLVEFGGRVVQDLNLLHTFRSTYLKFDIVFFRGKKFISSTAYAYPV